MPEFNAGAMENPGLVTFRDEFVFRSAVTDTERQRRAMVVAHEMAHMWFGDLVTLRWWDDIWLNESFAEYMGYQTLNEVTPAKPGAQPPRWRGDGTWTDFGVSRKTWGYDADQRPSTHPVAPDTSRTPPPHCSTSTASPTPRAPPPCASSSPGSARRTSSPPHQHPLRAVPLRQRFYLAEFIDSLASATERDVHAWADAWLRTSGVDILTATVDAVPGRWTLTLDREGSRPHRVTVGVYDRDLSDGRTLTLRERYEADVPHTDAPEPRPGTRPALVVPNDLDLTYAKIRLDETSLETVLRGLSGIPDALTRAVVWNSLRDMVRDGDLAPSDFLATAAAHLPEETDVALVQGVLAFASTEVADHYLAPGRLARRARHPHRPVPRPHPPHRGRRPPGPAPGRGAPQHRRRGTPETIAAWLADGTVPGGPELDPELRWRILARLAVLGAVDESAVAEELRRDPSATGQEGAARCRAALPDPDAKARAWDAMFGSDDLSNYLFTATAQGFWQPEQADLVRPYVARYFKDAVAVAARRGPAIATAVYRWAFPAHAVDAETLRLGEKTLRKADPVPALRRQFTDRLDDLARALRVQEA